MKRYFKLSKLFMALGTILVLSVALSVNCFSYVATAPIQADEFLLFDAYVQNQTIGELIGGTGGNGSPVYTYYPEEKKLISHVNIPNYNPSTKVISISGTTFSEFAGNPTSAINAYDTLFVENTFFVDNDLTLYFYMNDQYRKVELGGYWTETVETISGTGNGRIFKTYTVRNLGIHKKSNLIVPKATPISFTMPTPTPTIRSTPTIRTTPTSKVSPQRYSISGYISSDSLQVPKDGNDNFKVEISGTGLSALTDKSGHFKIDSVKETEFNEGCYLITVSKAGYLKRTFSLALVKDAEIGSASMPTLMISGDINGDARINMSDIMLLAKVFNTTSAESRFNADADLNFDKVVNMSDVLIIAKNFNKTFEDYTHPIITGNITIKKNETFNIVFIEGGIAGTISHYEIIDDNIVKPKYDKPDRYYKGDMGIVTWTFEGISAGTTYITCYSEADGYPITRVTVVDDTTPTPTVVPSEPPVALN